METRDGANQCDGCHNDQPLTIAAQPGHAPQVGWVEIGEGRRWLIRGLTISPSLAPTAPDRRLQSLVTLGEQGGDDSAELVVEDCFIYMTFRDSGALLRRGDFGLTSELSECEVEGGQFLV
jgi:hypothetical protein